jgi:alpha-tubulin suppressor-like RCC1 family protein
LNTQGELGNNSGTSSSVPVLVGNAEFSGKTIVSLAGGQFHSAAYCSDGTVATWGNSSVGQLGYNSTAGTQYPVPVIPNGVLGAKTAVSISAGANHCVALCSDSTVATWGFGGDGELGNNTTANSLVPVSASTSILATGEGFAAAVSGQSADHNLGLVATPPAPGASTLAATSLSPTGATLNGTVSAAGSSATVFFDYGLTTSYGTTVSGTPTPVTGSAATAVSVSLSGLSPSTVYHYRVRASDASGTTNGADGTFTTYFSWTYNAATDVPLTANGYTAAGPASLTLNFAPPAGTTLMMVKNTGLPFISGAFSNIAQGQIVTLAYQGINYKFVANYYGGTGNDLVLQWANTRLEAWGSNVDGQIGDNSTTSRLQPVNVLTTGVLSGKTIIALAAGNVHSLALCSDGTLAAWGHNANGELGNNSTTDSHVPVLVSTSGVLSGKTVIAISVGQDHNLALCSDGTVAAWGYNGDGELGNNNTTNSLVPVLVNTSGVLSGKTVVAISAGALHSLVLCSDGTLAAWGYNTDGELGNNSTTNKSVPVLVNTSGVLSGKTVAAIAAGGSHSLAVCSDGTLASWGSNNYDQLGNDGGTSSSVPVLVDTTGVLSGKTVVSIAAGGAHSLALCSDGTLAAWGYGGDGEMGNNSTTVYNSAPVLVSTSGFLPGETIISLSAAANHSLVLCLDGTLAAWGLNNDGQLGINSSTVDSTVPVSVSTASLASGENFAMAISGQSAAHSLALVGFQPPSPPVVVTLAATSLSMTGATMNGTVNAAGFSTAVSFDYGLTTAYGTNVAGTPTPVTGSTATAVSKVLTGLSPGTTYHFRVNGVSTQGTTNGSDLTFTTLTNFQSWRQTYFGTTSNSGNAADTATPQNDGVENIIKFATGMDPTKHGVAPGKIGTSGTNLTFTYTPSAAAVADGLTFTVQYSDTLLGGSWKTDVVNQGTIGSGGSPVTATVPEGSNGHRFLQLSVTGP